MHEFVKALFKIVRTIMLVQFCCLCMCSAYYIVHLDSFAHCAGRVGADARPNNCVFLDKCKLVVSMQSGVDRGQANVLHVAHACVRPCAERGG